MRKFAVILLSFIFIFSMLPITVTRVSATTDEIWDGTVATSFESGTGTENDPFIIANGKQLAYFAQQVNSGTTYSELYIKLNADIALNDTSNLDNWALAAPNNNWTAIGSYVDIYNNKAFKGTFDGNEYEISGIYINTVNDCQGLFGYSQNATIKNVGIVDSYICGGSYVAGVVAYNNAYKSSLDTTSTVTTATVSNCYNKSIITGYNYVSGVVGYNNSKINLTKYTTTATTIISSCYNTGKVTSSDCTGGVVGYNNVEDLLSKEKGATAIISNCYNTGEIIGDIIGGIVGKNYIQSDLYKSNIKISNCYNTGTINGRADVGGVVGECYAYSSADNRSYATIDVLNCYNTGTVSGEIEVGGVVGSCCSIVSTITVSSCYNTGTVSGKYNIGGVIGTNFINSSTPIISNCYYLSKTANGGINGVDVINSATALAFSQMTKADNYIGFDFENEWSIDNGLPPYLKTFGNSHVAVKTLSFAESSYLCFVSESISLPVEYTPQNTNIKCINYSSLNENIATVDSNGTVKGISNGTTKIIATDIVSGLVAYCNVTVDTMHPKSIELDKTEISLYTGETTTLIATVLPENTINKDVTWKSSNSSVAAVTFYGKINALSVGTTEITATTKDGGLTAVCTVTVYQHTLGVSISNNDVKIKVNEKLQIEAVVSPYNTSNNNITWTSSNDNFVAVDENGIITGVAEGIATITVKTEDGGFTAICIVEVSGYQELFTYGDVNNDGTINSKDSLSLKKFLACWEEAINEDAADVNVDGSINAKDSLLLKQFLACWPVKIGK